ncbi:MAG: hypothetical protein H7224_08010 [Polaromonas sp.]|nr:hypothetical protein [Polaromonas sp.]
MFGRVTRKWPEAFTAASWSGVLARDLAGQQSVPRRRRLPAGGQQRGDREHSQAPGQAASR